MHPEIEQVRNLVACAQGCVPADAGEIYLLELRAQLLFWASCVCARLLASERKRPQHYLPRPKYIR